MGTVYCGPYADQIGYHRHEGYADRLMPNGEFSNGAWSVRYPADMHVAFVAACSCGWRSGKNHPLTDSGEEQALGEWDRNHLQPLIRAEARNHAVQVGMLPDFVRSLRESAPRTVNDDGETVFTEYAVGLLEAAEQLLDGLSSVETRRVRGRR